MLPYCGYSRYKREIISRIIYCIKQRPFTYDHRLWGLGHPVRSAILKLVIGGLVVESVTTSEYPLLYVFIFFGSAFSFCFGFGDSHEPGLSANNNLLLRE